MWENLLKEIYDFDYVVQRNWYDLPNSTEKHDDLDLFVSLEDYSELELITRNYDLVDVRYPGDGYYPPEIEAILLEDRIDNGGYWIPSPKAHFLSLYYHNLVHKQSHPYDIECEHLFKRWIKPTKCIDEGVGFYV